MASDKYFTHKRNFTSGELSDILSEKIDFDRYTNGCQELLNMVVMPQGPATRRCGFEFKYDLTTLLGGEVNDVRPRAIPFVFNRNQAYVLIFFQHTGTGNTRVVVATRDGLVEDPITPGNPYVFEFTGTMDIEQMDYVQSNDVLKIVQPERIPVDFTRLAHDEWSAAEFDPTNLPTGASGFDAPDNWPTRIGYFEQRLVLAATNNRPQTLWFSRGGVFDDFIVGTAAADDPMALTLNSGSQNVIEWLSTARVLLIGTLGDEWDVSGKGQEPLSFESFRMVRHTQQGSENIKPIMIGPVTIFVEHLGRTVSQLGYDYASDSYDTVDLSVLAPHLTKRNKIVDWAYQKLPNGVIWSVRDDGLGLGLTMKREHNVVGWHRHTTDGSFLDFACIPGDYEHDLFAIVEREIGGVTKWYLEVKSPEFVEEDAKYGKFLDSFLVYDEEIATDTVSGLDHLEGKTVSILADGRPQPDQIVLSGSITLSKSFNYIVVGLPYRSRLVSTEPVYSLPDGLSRHRVVDKVEATVSVKDSAGCSIGIEQADGTVKGQFKHLRLAEQPDGTSARLVTRSIKVDIYEPSANADIASIQRVAITQELPLPLTVLGITEQFYLAED